MTWLLVPVTVYSIGILILWLILRGRRADIPSAAGPLPRVTDDTTSSASILPRVTVVVAARNEEKTIETLLESLSYQDYPPDLLEITIVNDNSTDRTPIVVSEFIERRRQVSAIRMRLIFNPFSGKKRAIRYGIEKASGELIMTTDADCTVGPGWVSAHAGEYAYEGENAHTGVGADGSADMIVGEVYQGPPKGFTSLFGMFEFSALQSISEAAIIAGRPVMCNAANMSFKRDVYLRHSGELRADLPSGDDIFLLHAVRRAGGRVRYAGSSAAAVETAGAVTAAALLRQRARWASKTFWYSDAATLTLVAVTAACNAAVTAAAVASIISTAYLPLLAALYGLRLAPDYLIITRNIKKRGGKVPVMTFILSELIYPFYFMTVGVMSLFPAARKFAKR